MDQEAIPTHYLMKYAEIQILSYPITWPFIVLIKIHLLVLYLIFTLTSTHKFLI